MKIYMILRKRKSICKTAGKLSFYFFPSLLLAAIFISAALTLFIDGLFKIPEIKAVYSDAVMSAVPIIPQNFSNNTPDFFIAFANQLSLFIKGLFSLLPPILTSVLSLVFLISPIYQGTIRWSAYLIEEKTSLPISAALFYFTSPRLYFLSVFLSLRLVLLRFFSALLFYAPPIILYLLGSAFASDYLGQVALGSAIILLSFILLPLLTFFYLLFCIRFSAVRYLFALGNFKKIFSSSNKLMRSRTIKTLLLNLRLSLDFIPALFILTAPACTSRAISGKCLYINALLNEKAKPRYNQASP